MITDPQIFKIPDMPFGRFCKIGITGRENLVLAEVEVYGKYKLPSGPAILTDGNIGPDARLGNVLTIVPDTGGKAWVELDLLNMYEMESIVLYTGRSDDAGKNRVIAVTCLDDTKKRTGKAFSCAPENERVVVLPANVKNCRFVRVESAKGDSLPLAEIGVWGRSGNK